ncbi:hypothetical protein GGI07_002582 [Coemansia sp. Benny D115]|nr:hypothetical protein GGI07_002582 [Coemansia sp. Benny D115]
MADKRKSSELKESSKRTKSHKSGKTSGSGSDQEIVQRRFMGQSTIPYPKSIDLSSFVETKARLTVTLAPIYTNDFMAGVYEALNNMLLQYVPQARGVVLSYAKIKCLTDSALLFNDSPYGQLDISVNLLLWRPISGMTLEGIINVQSPDHIGMLLWDTFNASIPATFIPKDKYEWRPFSDEEIASHVVPTVDDDEQPEQDDSAVKDEYESVTPVAGTGSAVPTRQDKKYGSGEWVFKGTSQSVGAQGALKFMVVDVIRANEVLSVTGALQ